MKSINERKLQRLVTLAVLGMAIHAPQAAGTAYANASGNEVTVTEENYTINGETYDNDEQIDVVAGGESDGEELSGAVIGGTDTSGKANENVVKVSGGEIGSGAESDGVQGGRADVEANSNLVQITGGKIDGDVHGGLGMNEGVAADNIVEIESGEITGNVYGGSGAEGTGNNSVEIIGGEIGGNVYGGELTAAGELKDNVVKIEGGSMSEVYGGYSESGSVTENIVNISGGKITGDVYGGRTDSGDAAGNTVNLYGGVFGGSFYGGHSHYGSSSGNTLNVYGKGLTARNVYDFQNMNFYLGADVEAGDTMLTLTDGETDLSGTDVFALMNKDSTLQEGDSVTLLENEEGISAAKSLKGEVYEGISLTHKLDVELSADKSKIVATFGEIATSSASGNAVTLNESGYTINGSDYSYAGERNVYGGSGAGKITGAIVGGWDNTGISSGNVVNWYGGSFSGGIYGGRAATSSGNTLNVYGKNLSAQNVYDFQSMNFYLGADIGNGDTMLTLTGDATDLSSTDVAAIMNKDSTLADGDSVTLLTNENGISAAKSLKGTAYEGISLTHDLDLTNDGNSLIATLTDKTRSANGNAVTLNESGYTINGSNYSYSGESNVYGGYGAGKITGAILGGWDNTGIASGNTINWYGGNFSNLYGGRAATSSGNTLNIYGKNLSAQNLYDFQSMNFYLGAEIGNGDTMLTLTGDATDLSGTDVAAIMNKDSTLADGDSVTLLTNENGISAAKSLKGTAYEGISLTHDLDLTNDGNSLIATLTDKTRSASGNAVTLNESSYTINGSSFSYSGERDVYGGYGAGKITGAILGGWDNTGISSGNVVNWYGGSFSNLYGGRAATSSGNVLNIYGKNLSAQNLYDFQSMNFYLGADIGDGDTMLTLTGEATDLSSTDVAAIMSKDSTLEDGDSVTLLTNENGISAAKSLKGTAYEGISLTHELDLTNDGNSLIATLNDTTRSASGNAVTLNESGYTINGNSYSYSGESNVYGGYGDGKITGAVIGGWDNTGVSSGNVVNWYGGSFSNLYGGRAATSSSNVLNIYGKNLSAQNLYDFQSMNFYLGADISNGDTMLTLTGEATDLSSTDVAAIMDKDSALADGDSVTLLTNENGISAAKSLKGTAYEGISLTHDLDLTNDGNSLTATLTDKTRSASGNAVTLNESGYTINGTTYNYSGESNVYGGYGSGKITGAVVGGWDNTGISSGNVVNWYGGSFSNLYGGRAATSSGNVLNIYGKNLSAQNLYDFQSMNFYLGAEIGNGDTMLTLTGDATDLSSADVAAIMNEDSTLADGDAVTLLTNENGISAAKSLKGTAYEGISLTHELDLTNDGNSLTATLTDKTRSASGNAVTLNESSYTINGVTLSYADEFSDAYGGYSGSGRLLGAIVGGTESAASASQNTVTLRGDAFNIYGGFSESADAIGNTVNLYSGVYSGNIYGGHAPNGTSSGNVLNVYGKNLTAQNLFDFQNMNFYLGSEIEAGDTMLTLTDSAGTNLSRAEITAVMQRNSPLADGDSVTLIENENGVTAAKSLTGKAYEGISLTHELKLERSGGTAIIATLNDITPTPTPEPEPEPEPQPEPEPEPSPVEPVDTGGGSKNSLAITENSYTINNETKTFSGTVDKVFGGRAAAAEEISGSNIIGGYTATGDASGNTLTFSGGTFTGNIYGGYSEDGSASSNTLNLNGGTFSGNIFGGYGLTADDNVINIRNSPNLTNAFIFGGQIFSSSGADLASSFDDVLSGNNNTLNIYNKNITAQNIAALTNLNFYIPNDVTNGDTMLTLTDSAGTDISNMNVRAGVIAGNSNLRAGDTINLLTNSNGLTANGTTYGTLTEGVSLRYGLDISKSGNSVLATLTSSPNLTLNGETQTIAQDGIVGIKTVDTTFDNLNSWLPPSVDDFSDVEKDEDLLEPDIIPVVDPKGWEIFANMGTGSVRTKTGNGSYVDMNNRNIDLGFARSIEGRVGKLIIAPIVDYSSADYDSYLGDGTHGSGSTSYIAGGLIGRYMYDTGFYVESSLRGGRIKTDFSSDNLDKSGVIGTVSYDTSATTVAGHLRLGKNFRLNKNNLLDVYSIYFHAHQGGMNADLSSGEHYRISQATSSRTRFGYRLTTLTSKVSRVYTGMAYQFEHATGVTATYLARNLSTKSAGNDGHTGILELGWQIKPVKNNPWMVDINATGLIGHQRGITAMAKVQKSF